MRRIGAVALLVVVAALGAADASTTMKMAGANPTDARTALRFYGWKPLDVAFERMVVRAAETPDLLRLIEDAAALPSGSQVTFSGAVESAPFSAKVEKSRSGHAEVKLKGLAFTDPRQMLDLVGNLAARGVTEVRLKGRLGDRRVRLELDEGG